MCSASFLTRFSLYAEDPPIPLRGRTAPGEVVEGLVRRVDQQGFDEGRALPGPLPKVLDAALPLQDRPGTVPDLGQGGEDLLEIHISIPQAAEAPGTFPQ